MLRVVVAEQKCLLANLGRAANAAVVLADLGRTANAAVVLHSIALPKIAKMAVPLLLHGQAFVLHTLSCV